VTIAIAIAIKARRIFTPYTKEAAREFRAKPIEHNPVRIAFPWIIRLETKEH
jgi:hypothetical protein